MVMILRKGKQNALPCLKGVGIKREMAFENLPLAHTPGTLFGHFIKSPSHDEVKSLWSGGSGWGKLTFGVTSDTTATVSSSCFRSVAK